jgi:ABC-type transporter Mla subunit MlaD
MIAAIVLMAGCSRHGATIAADVPTSAHVVPGTTVRFRGTDVGHVTSVAPIRSGVHVELVLNRVDAPVRADDRIAIRVDGIFGATIVDILPGSESAPPIAHRATLAAARPDSLDDAHAAVLRAAGEALLTRLQDDLRRPRSAGSRP